MCNGWLDNISPQLHGSGHITFVQGVINPWRIIADHELFMFSSGESELVFEKWGTFPCPAGTFLIIPSGVKHISYALSSEIHIHWTHFDWIWQDDIPMSNPWIWWEDSVLCNSEEGSEDSLPPIRPTPPFVPERVLYGSISPASRAWNFHMQLCEDFNAPTIRRSSRGIMIALLEELLSQPERKQTRYDISQRLAVGIQARLAELANIPFNKAPLLKKAFESFDYDYCHLERVFRKEFNLPPLAYLNLIRIEKIKTLLIQTDKSVKTIAYELGFDDLAYFSRFFKKHTGMTPSAFRKTEQQ